MTASWQDGRVAVDEQLNIDKFLDHINVDEPGDMIFERSVEAVAPKAASIILGGGASAFIDQATNGISEADAFAQFRVEAEAFKKIGSVVARVAQPE